MPTHLKQTKDLLNLMFGFVLGESWFSTKLAVKYFK